MYLLALQYTSAANFLQNLARVASPTYAAHVTTQVVKLLFSRTMITGTPAHEKPVSMNLAQDGCQGPQRLAIYLKSLYRLTTALQTGCHALAPQTTKQFAGAMMISKVSLYSMGSSTCKCCRSSSSTAGMSSTLPEHARLVRR